MYIPLFYIGVITYPNRNVAIHMYTDSKVHGVNMGPIWGRQDQGGPHVGPVNFAIWVATYLVNNITEQQLS